MNRARHYENLFQKRIKPISIRS